MKAKTKLPKVKIENGLKFVYSGNCYSFVGIVRTIDSFHNYSSKQTLKTY